MNNKALFSITTDGYPEETTGNIVDNDGNIVLSGGPYEERANTLYTSEGACVPLGCYTLQLMDSYGDGFDGNFDLELVCTPSPRNGVVLQQVFPIFYDMGTYSFCEQEGEAAPTHTLAITTSPLPTMMGLVFLFPILS